MKEYLDHHNRNYVGLGDCANGIDDNNYVFKEALKNLEK